MHAWEGCLLVYTSRSDKVRYEVEDAKALILENTKRSEGVTEVH